MLPQRTALLGAAVAVTTLVAACGNAADPGSAPALTASETTVPVAVVTTAVVDAGAEPREPVQFAFGPGPQDTVLTTRSEVHQQIGDQPQQDLSTPSVTMPLTATPTPATSGLTGPAASVDLALGLPVSPNEQLATALTASEDSRAGLSILPSGAITALRITPPTASPDVARSAIEQAFYQAVYRAVVFPDAPIGPGAVWTIRQQVASGMSLSQVTTATLRERHGTRLTVDVSVDQSPDSPVWHLPGGSGALSIDQFVMSGTGTLVVDLTAPLPIEGAVTVAGEQVYTDQANVTRLRQNTANSVRWQQR